MECPLCINKNLVIKLIKKDERIYRECQTCGLIFLDKEFQLTIDEENAHYLSHNNDVDDPGYQKFVMPIVDYVTSSIKPGATGLDYGAGPGPVASRLLIKHQYVMKLYDPFFWNEPSVLNEKFDFIVASEVAEHFSRPRFEFERLKGLLKSGGELIVMTKVLKEDTNFTNWHYHQDPTHIVFYAPKTFQWIRHNLSFSDVVSPHPNVWVLRV